ncbi:hexose transporter [Colletotrichum caudatum]|nr:hexose transporter [Colletotrichum caudatum]
MKDEQIAGAALAEVLPRTDKHWFQQPHLLRFNVLLLVPLLSSSVVGYDGSLMNGLQSLRQWREYFGNPTGVKLGVVNAAQSIGSVLALPIIGYLADRFGRKPVLLSGIILIIIATIVPSTSINLPMFIVSRLVVGFGGMFVVHPSPMLIAELAYPTHRGKYTSAFWTMYYLGAILASWTTFGCQDYQSEWAWRIPSILEAGFPLVQLCFYAWVTESPRWLVARERTAEAAAILARYHSGVLDPAEGHTPLVRREVAEIPSPSVVSYYLTLVLDTVGITDTFTQTLINGLLQIFNFGAALGAAFLVDRLGRRTLFLWSGAGILASYIVWTACSAVNTETGSKPAGIVVVVCLFTFYFHYDIAYTPLLLGSPTEILPYSLRSKGIALELFAIYGSLVIAAFVNPTGLENIGWRYYIVFCCLLAVFFAVTWHLFPETKGHSLEEIAVIFDGPQAVEDFEGSSDSKEEKILAKGGLHDVVHKERV